DRGVARAGGRLRDPGPRRGSGAPDRGRFPQRRGAARGRAPRPLARTALSRRFAADLAIARPAGAHRPRIALRYTAPRTRPAVTEFPPVTSAIWPCPAPPIWASSATSPVSVAATWRSTSERRDRKS